MGLLDSIDPQILALLQGPSQSDADAIRRHQLLTAGLAMMQHSNMKPIQAIGYGGQVGLQAGYDEQMRQAQERAQRLGGFSQAMALQNQLQQFQDQADLRKTEQGFADRFGGPGAPQPTQVAPPSAAPPTVPVQTALPQTAPPPGISPKDWQAAMADAANTPGATMSYTPPGARSAVQMPMPGSLSQQQMPAPATNVPPKPQKYEMYQQWGDYLSSQSHGNPLVMAQAQKYYDLAEKFRPKPVGEPKEVTMNGQRVMVQNYDSGPPQIMPYAPAQDKPERVDKGGSYGFIDPRTLQPVGPDVPKTQSPDSAASIAESKRKTNLEYGLDEQGVPTGNLDKYAEMVAKYDTPFPPTIMYRRPEMGAQLMAKVQAINPSFDQKNYPVAQATMTAFAKGKEAQTVRALNNVVDHMDLLSQLVQAQGNGDIQTINALKNRVRQEFGNADVTNVAGVKKLVADEITKAVTGSSGGVADRSEYAQALANSNSVPQILGIVSNYKALMTSQLNSLVRQYETSAQRPFPQEMLSPNVRRQLAASVPPNVDVRKQADKILGQ